MSGRMMDDATATKAENTPNGHYDEAIQSIEADPGPIDMGTHADSVQ